MSFREAVPYVVAAYMGIWALLFVYLLVLGSRLSGLRREIDALTKTVEKKQEG